jgi:hypothetical protein
MTKEQLIEMILEIVGSNTETGDLTAVEILLENMSTSTLVAMYHDL